MKIAIGYSYLNGEKEHQRALEPWLPHVDYVIAINGRYRTPLPPYLRAKYTSNYSTDRSQRVLKKLSGKKLIHENLYGTQMEKRQRYLDIAGELGCDFVITVDTDDYIHPQYQDWNKFNNQLEAVLKHWDDKVYYMWAYIPNEELWSKQHNEIQSNAWRQYSRIHKNPGTIRYCQNHWMWADKETTDEQINLWKWDKANSGKDEYKDNPYLLQTNTTLDGIRITTDRTLRTASDNEFGDSWTFQQIHWESFTYKLCPYLKYKGVKCIGMDLPMEQYYFKPAGKIGDEDAGQIVLINDDNTETKTEQHFNINPTL